MKKIMYIVLIVVSLGLIGYTVFYTITNSTISELPVVATSTEEIVATPLNPSDDPKNILTTQKGKKIKIVEENPVGESLSTISISLMDVASATPLVLETNKLSRFVLADLNKDSFDEIILITEAAGSGSYGEATIYTTAVNATITPVTIPEVTEEDTDKGGLFEGYMGHDIFNLKDGQLIREFPIYKDTDTNAIRPTSTRSIIYSLSEKNGAYFVLFKKYMPSTQVSSSSPVLSSMASGTPKQLPSSTSTSANSAKP